MAVFKCKMCGGSLDIGENMTVIECDYCGTKQTLPKLNDERIVNLYDRASHFRRNDDFDKASAIYEEILKENSTDAEAYWSLVLCRYGIEYVEDPLSRKRIPTVNRMQYTSVFDDDNYRSALEYADAEQRAVYADEAKAINEIQKGILDISNKEEPFDVFICYKETDANGRRTRDSVLANELYHELTEEGFKVFFSRITLEDKLGTAYEPYIFAALNSAKVMVVIGTKKEYFQAVWVKNEWSRYLSLIKQGQKKMLVPAYRDMDPYDLPDEFSHLQAQDMNKLGFMQDLIRGIKKIVGKEEKSAPQAAESRSGSGINPLIKRAFIFMDDGEWDTAASYLEKVLDQEPENAYAYLGKLMIDYGISDQNKLKNADKELLGNGNFVKAMRYADSELRATLNEYKNAVLNREAEKMYVDALNRMEGARTQEEFLLVASLFEGEILKGYKDSLIKADECRKNGVIAYKKYTYERAINHMNGGRYAEAVKEFENVPDYLDSQEYILKCKAELEQLQAVYASSYDMALKNFQKGINYQGEGNLSMAYDSYKSALDTFIKLGDYKTSAADAAQVKLKLQEVEQECNPTVIFEIPKNSNPLSLASGSHYYYTLVEKNTSEVYHFDVLLASPKNSVFAGATVQEERVKQGTYSVNLKVYGYADTPGVATPMHDVNSTVTLKNFQSVHIVANNPGIFSKVKIEVR